LGAPAALDAGLVLRAYSPWANHPFYGWFWLFNSYISINNCLLYRIFVQFIMLLR